MLIRILGGKGGIKDYLETGKKQGRSFTRDEMDERVILAGDLDITDAIIQQMDTEGERYLHITLGIKENEVSREILESIVQDFQAFAFSAYRADEYSFYAEAHLSRIKNLTNEQTGKFEERLPHIHIVIPKTNLLTGQHLNPFGVVDRNQEFIDAFQEYTNHKYGLASPKDNLRFKSTGAPEMISRYKGDIFESGNQKLKAEILEAVVSKNINRYGDFKAMLTEYGELKTRNKGRPGEYQNIKPGDMAKGINLKEHVFSREFIELTADEKIKQLSTAVVRPAVRKSPQELLSTLQEWHKVRAKELKYINSGNRRLYARYRAGCEEQRCLILYERETLFYGKYQESALDHNIPLSEGDRINPASTDGQRKTRATGRVDDSVLSQIVRDHEEHKQIQINEQKSEMQEIKLKLDASRILAEMSQSYGVIPENYEITKGKDGGDRIKCGTRHLNVSDFLVKELNLPWAEASIIMRESYTRQLNLEPAKLPRREPHRSLWREFQAHRRNAYERQKVIKTEFNAKRDEIRNNRSLTSTERKAAISIVRMEKVAKEAGGRIRRHRPTNEQYLDFLIEKANTGDEQALNELRRMQSQTTGKEKDTDVVIKPGELQPIAQMAPIYRDPVIFYQVHGDGDVTYKRDGQAVLRDAGQRVQMLRDDNATIEIGLRLAQQKFGSTLVLSGSQSFQNKAATIAAEAGLNVQFTDNHLNRVMAERKVQIEVARRIHSTVKKTPGMRR